MVLSLESRECGGGMETDTICQITEGESRVEALCRVWPDKLIAKESDA